jgi:hypothetical protein
MHSVQLSDDVYAALQGLAVPFEDDINDVLRRVLRLRSQIDGNGRPRPDGHIDTSLWMAEHPATRSLSQVSDGPTVVVHRRTTNGAALPQSTFRTAVIGILRSAESSVSVPDLMRAIEQQLASRMTDNDIEVLPSGIARWQSQLRNALTQLQHEGAIEQVQDGWYRYRGNLTR